ncbi:hypothetical protein JV16_02428 [Anoxybacillus ayderensis]|uniref:DUF2642 domain-containing protein n=2 Tax=Anoxybacillaceae TaxID=3120669 RepID=A0A0D0G4Y6_9BACL|nr:hypothetical protein C289_0513 [Anoxybacillus ayderensis]KHF28132.1 hypothetical protein LR68_03069 [Anoxybacillus sp. BCO1]KIP20380.1 hypothetical protein JV16_02428 [Anoxybacillus ayderensis]
MEKNKREGGKKMTPQFMSFIDPYVYQTLQTIRGKEVIIETVRGNVQGVIQDVKPDHIVLKSSDTFFFVRIQQIVWIMPK